MNTALIPSIPVIVAVIVALSTWFGAITARRRDRADAASVLTSTALALVDPLNVQLAELRTSIIGLHGEVSGLKSDKLLLDHSIIELQRKVDGLDADKRMLTIENAVLLARVDVLERQVLTLGHIPQNGGGQVVAVEHHQVEQMSEPTLKDVMTPTARAWTYIALSVLTPISTTVVAVLNDGWQAPDALLIATSVIGSLGLLMARSNTPAPEPPPAL